MLRNLNLYIALTALGLFKISHCLEPYSYDIASCQSFITEFQNTCDVTDPPLEDFEIMDYEEVSCNRPGLCPDLTTYVNCNWKRILCLTCR